MTTTRFEASGVLRHENGRLHIELHDAPTGIPAGSPVKVVYWSDSASTPQNAIDLIAQTQQIELATVTLGLGAAAAFSSIRDQYAARLTRAIGEPGVII